jgi:subtilisin family serine protease
MPDNSSNRDNVSQRDGAGALPQQPEDARASAQRDNAAAPSSEFRADSPGRAVSERRGQFLIAPRKPQGLMPMGFMPLQFSTVEQTLRGSPDIEVIDTVGPKNMVGMLADGMGDANGVLVARMTEQKAAILAQQTHGRLIVERDHPLTLAEMAFQFPPLVSGMMPAAGPVLATVVVVLGKDGVPIEGAEVYLFGSMLPATGITDKSGKVTLSLFGDTAESIRGLYVKPKSDYWSFYQEQPDITINEANIVGLRPLSEWPSLANFPRQQVYGWGQKAMRLDQVPGNYRGQGIKVAVIDSGADNAHDDLRKIRFGFDVIGKKSHPDGWTVDTIAHGSHCAGIIAGADNSIGVRGFAPDAEIHACKLFPGGQISQLIDALEYCIEKQIDVVNLSLGGAEPSEALEQQILRAKRAGIACIVAAGNSGNRVQYPASSPNVLAVSAIGKFNEFPPDSYHTQTTTPLIDQNGFFAAKFSCFGPEIAVCGPGVAIASSVPPNNYAAWDGTSMAAPHITGLAALVLAHHPDFQGPFKAKTAERVERLFQIIKISARPVNLGDPSRTGFGLPDALIAIGLQPSPGISTVPPSPHPPGGSRNAASPMMSAQAGGTVGNQLGSAIGGAFGNSQLSGGMGQAGALGTASFQPYANAYVDNTQLGPQAWMGNPWGQMQQAGGMLSPNAYDPYAAYFTPYFTQPQMAASIQGFGFGMQPGFSGGQRWS